MRKEAQYAPNKRRQKNRVKSFKNTEREREPRLRIG